jgi:2,4-dienoyl-CoA reductase-like NADH-dependent reductase (Old Yellow Enzyme family)
MPGETPLDSTPMETFGTYVDALSDLELLYLHAIEGETQQDRNAVGDISFPELRRRFSGAYIANNQCTLELAEETLARGDADLFSFGRPFLANPDLVARLRTGAPLAEAPKQYWYGGSGDWLFRLADNKSARRKHRDRSRFTQRRREVTTFPLQIYTKIYTSIFVGSTTF